MKKLNVITLGCSKNVVDSERISAQLAAAGWKVVHNSPIADSDVVVVNTCGFIGDAKEESINTILDCVQAKNQGAIDYLYVIGCLSERYRDELQNEIPEVDNYFGARDITQIVEQLGIRWQQNIATERVLSTPSHYAYLKISEGCDRRCGFCAIPLIRGKHISVPMEDLVHEAELLAAKGVKELIVIAQDTTYYGVDIYGERKLAELLRRLCKVDGIEWIRLHYAYPAGFPDDVIDVMAVEPKICKYLDIPLQHISDNMLKSMKRGSGKEDTTGLIDKLQTRIPDIAIRTTMLVGYPGESEQDFEELKNFVNSVKFDRLGVFPYSEEEGTYSATELHDDVPEQVKQQRVEELMSLQSGISLQKNIQRIGQSMCVIIDRHEQDYYVARTQYDSPEVDQEVLIKINDGATRLQAGSFAQVRIVDAEDFDLYAELIV